MVSSAATNGPSETGSTVETMSLDGGAECLDFVNTASARDPGPLREKLRGYGDLVTFGVRVGVLTEAQGSGLRAAAAANPVEARAVLARAVALREAIFRLFAREPAEADLSLLAEEAGLASAERRLIAEGGGYRFIWPDSDRLDRVLWPLAHSAAELLTSAARERVKECAAGSCSWLFLDLSRNRSRRWCDMAVCGNRAKARRFSERQKGG